MVACFLRSYSTCMGNLRNHAAANKTLGTSSLHLPKGLLAHLQDNIFGTHMCRTARTHARTHTSTRQHIV
jgi:hypothetical protein